MRKMSHQLRTMAKKWAALASPNKTPEQCRAELELINRERLADFSPEQTDTRPIPRKRRRLTNEG